MTKLKIKKGDNVKIITGDDKGKTGNVIKVFPEIRKILVKGVNEKKKHQKPTKEKKGGIITIEKNWTQLEEFALNKKKSEWYNEWINDIKNNFYIKRNPLNYPQ